MVQGVLERPQVSTHQLDSHTDPLPLGDDPPDDPMGARTRVPSSSMLLSVKTRSFVPFSIRGGVPTRS